MAWRIITMIMDVSDYFEDKLAALEAFRSQLFNPGYEGPDTMVSSEAFWEAIRTRASYWGDRIDADYGEPLYADGPLPMTLLPGVEIEE